MKVLYQVNDSLVFKMKNKQFKCIRFSIVKKMYRENYNIYYSNIYILTKLSIFKCVLAIELDLQHYNALEN